VAFLPGRVALYGPDGPKDNSMKNELKTRLKAFERLPELLDKIIEQAERLAQTTEATRVKVDARIGREEPVEVEQGFRPDRRLAAHRLAWPR
jgi:hypothetical protein